MQLYSVLEGCRFTMSSASACKLLAVSDDMSHKDPFASQGVHQDTKPPLKAVSLVARVPFAQEAWGQLLCHKAVDSC